jgi:putative transposase
LSKPAAHGVYLLRKLAIKRSNQVEALDTIYIRMTRGFVYLTAVMDVNIRRILAHRVAIAPVAVHAFEMLQEAYFRVGIRFEYNQPGSPQ